MTWLRGHWQLLGLIALVVALWPTPVIVPLKVLVVFFHELSHALAAWLSGGEVVSISVNADEGGVTWTRGGNRFAILTAGYIGSLVLGVVLFLAALRTRFDRAIIAGLGLALLAVAGIYMRDLFALAFTGVAGVMMLAIARYLPHQASDLALRLIGLTSMIYVPADIFSDTLARSDLPSDARMLAEYLGGGTMLWGAVWLVLSLGVIALSLRYGLGRHSNLELSRADGDES